MEIALLKGTYFPYSCGVCMCVHTYIQYSLWNYCCIFKISSTLSLWDRQYGMHHFKIHTCILSEIVCPLVAPMPGVFISLALLTIHAHFGVRLCLPLSLKTPSVWRESIRKEIIYWSHGTGCLFPLIQRLSKQHIAHLIEYISSWCLQRVVVWGF